MDWLKTKLKIISENLSSSTRDIPIADSFTIYLVVLSPKNRKVSIREYITDYISYNELLNYRYDALGDNWTKIKPIIMDIIDEGDVVVASYETESSAEYFLYIATIKGLSNKNH